MPTVTKAARLRLSSSSTPSAPCARQGDRSLHDVLQRPIQIEFRADRQHGVEELAEVTRPEMIDLQVPQPSQLQPDRCRGGPARPGRQAFARATRRANRKAGRPPSACVESGPPAARGWATTSSRFRRAGTPSPVVGSAGLPVLSAFGRLPRSFAEARSHGEPSRRGSPGPKVPTRRALRPPLPERPHQRTGSICGPLPTTPQDTLRGDARQVWPTSSTTPARSCASTSTGPKATAAC
jgi:hypothetical protein